MKLISVYKNKDGRLRAYCRDEQNKPHIISYPKYLMEEHLGRKLAEDEEVHHIDGNPENNELNNLELVKHGEHQRFHNPRRYKDKIVVCEVCGASFLWVAWKQSDYKRDIKIGRNRIISCSRKCSSTVGRYIQLGYGLQESIQLARIRIIEQKQSL